MTTRRRHTRETRLIVVEGGTEERYLRSVTDWRPPTPKFINAKGHGGVGRALGATDLDHYTSIWVVVDAEGHPHEGCGTLARELDGLGEARNRLFVVLTSPKFEYWLLARFQRPPTSRREIDGILERDHCYAKPKLPAGLDPQEWPQAQQRIELRDRLSVEGFAEVAGNRQGETGECPLCSCGTALPHLVAHLSGSSGK